MSPVQILGLACIVAGLALILSSICDCVQLSIIGHSTGQGLHSLSFQGDSLNATILQGLNCSSWNVTARGMA